MIIVIDHHTCIHLACRSSYNNNYYLLPVIVNDCNILYSSYDGGENFQGHSIGILNNNVYEPKYWLHTEDKDDGNFIIDSELIKTENEWT